MFPNRTDYSTGFTPSRALHILTRARANQFMLTNAVSSDGALWRALQVPGLRLSSIVFGWWSRGWVGQVLGLAWCIAAFRKGLNDNLEPAETGDDWETYKAGKIPTPQP